MSYKSHNGNIEFSEVYYIENVLQDMRLCVLLHVSTNR